MGLLSLFTIASMPVLKVILISALGLFLSFERFNLILGENARVHLNKMVFFVFNPALVGSNLAKTITFESFLSLWFMPINILITFLVGSMLGWILVKITKAPNHLKGLIIGSCSAGNLGNLLIIIVPAICNEKGSPFGDAETCHTFALAYSSFSMALGAIVMWSYVYNIIRISSETEQRLVEDSRGELINDRHALESDEKTQLNMRTEPLLQPENQLPVSSSNSIEQNDELPRSRIVQQIRKLAKKINLGALLSPSTIGTIVGFVVGTISPIRKLLIGRDAPLHVVQDSAYMIGDAAIPTITLILGANLLRGLKGGGIQLRIVMGIMGVRYIILPILGIGIVKGAIYYGLVPFDPLFVFVLLLQYALPPAINIGTVTQLFGAGQSECSVIMLWTYTSASIALALWCTLFLWIVTL